VSDRDLVEAIRCGARSFDELSRRCDGAGRDCGSCLQMLEDFLGDAKPAAVGRA
jgi:bacterioferritin-associated ferredoxin